MDHILWLSFCFCLDVQAVKGIIHKYHIIILCSTIPIHVWTVINFDVKSQLLKVGDQANSILVTHIPETEECSLLLVCISTNVYNDLFQSFSWPCFSMPVSSVKAAVQVLEEDWERGFNWFDIVE